LNHSILTKASKSSQPSTLSGHKRDSTADTITWANTEANAKIGSETPTTSTSEDVIPDYSTIYTELASIRSLCPSPVVLKLILETSQLTHLQIAAASHLAAAANFDFIKTSTGFNGPGAKLPDVRLMVAAAEYLSTKSKSNGGSPVRAKKMQVKASGGIRSLEDARKMLEAGATRLGTSSGLWLMQESRRIEQEKAGEQGGRPAGVSRLYTDDSVGGY
jgi:deoxyribose-phosphate aldolase